MAYVNKMDIMGANFYRVVDMMKERLKTNPVADPTADRCRGYFLRNY